MDSQTVGGGVVSMLVHRAPISYYRLFPKEVSDLPNLSPYRMQKNLHPKFFNCFSLFKCESKTFETVQLKERFITWVFPCPKLGDVVSQPRNFILCTFPIFIQIHVTHGCFPVVNQHYIDICTFGLKHYVIDDTSTLNGSCWSNHSGSFTISFVSCVDLDVLDTSRVVAIRKPGHCFMYSSTMMHSTKPLVPYALSHVTASRKPPWDFIDHVRTCSMHRSIHKPPRYL